MAQRVAALIGGFRFEADKAHAAPADVACDVSLRRDAIACSRMAHPRELLLGMEQPREIHSRIVITKKLRSCDAKRVNGGEGGRYAGRWIRAYRSGKLRRPLCVNLKSDRRVSSPGDGCNLAGL